MQKFVGQPLIQLLVEIGPHWSNIDRISSFMKTESFLTCLGFTEVSPRTFKSDVGLCFRNWLALLSNIGWHFCQNMVDVFDVRRFSGRVHEYYLSLEAPGYSKRPKKNSPSLSTILLFEKISILKIGQFYMFWKTRAGTSRQIV